MRGKKVLFVVGGDAPNPFHGELGRSLGADFFISDFMNARTFFFAKLFFTIKSAFTLPRNYDVYLTETAFVIPVLARMLGLLPKEAKIINLSADPVLYSLVHNEPLGLPRGMYMSMIKKVDGFVLVGSWSDYLDKLGIGVPRIETPAGINDKVYDTLIKMNKRDFNHNLIFVGNLTAARLRYKGADIMLSAFRIVKEKYPDAKLYITGHSELDWIKEKYPDVVFTGHTKNVGDALEHATICVNMGRGDAFPIGTVEAMLVGIPTIVSEYTGTKAVVREADKGFVMELNGRKVAEKIIWYFGLPEGQKRKISGKFRRVGSKYRTSIVLREFKKKWELLLKEVYRNE